MPQYTDEKMETQVREAVWIQKKKHFSTVWIIPIVALVIGLGLIWQNISQKGPTIQITFKSAEGIQADKSVIKYKDIKVGEVREIRFSNDLKSVIVTAELNKEMRPYLTEKTRFWIVHARLTADSVEGLDTLLSGAYIGMDPGREGKEIRKFRGLEEPPVLTEHLKGKTFVLEAENRGSLQIGSPVYYKKIKAGKVTSYRLTPNGNRVLIDVFVEEPFSRLVNTKTRFWNASGIDAEISPNGVEIRTESITSILSGGVAFDNFSVFGRGKPVKEKYHFILYKNIKKAQKITYKRELYFWVYFNESIRGLKIGAPIEYRGVKIGEVVNFYLTGDAETSEFQIPILFKIEPERFSVIGKPNLSEKDGVDAEILKKLVQRGFRAQLQNSNLLTGELLINLDFYPKAPPADLVKKNGLYVFPSVPATIESLKTNIQSILQSLAGVPFKKIGEETREILEAARKNYIDTNAELHRKMLKLLDELTRTSRSIRNLTDYLERHPESIIRGK